MGREKSSQLRRDEKVKGNVKARAMGKTTEVFDDLFGRILKNNQDCLYVAYTDAIARNAWNQFRQYLDDKNIDYRYGKSTSFVVTIPTKGAVTFKSMHSFNPGNKDYDNMKYAHYYKVFDNVDMLLPLNFDSVSIGVN